MYMIGWFLSVVGSQVQQWAIMWHVWELTESSAMVGALGLARVVPLIAFSLLGGVVADRVDRRKIMLATQGGMALVSIVLWSLSSSGLLTVWIIYVLVSLHASVRAFDGPARQSLLVNLVPERDFASAVRVSGVSWRLADVLGPLITGFFITRFESGVSVCYAFNAVSFAAIIVSLLLLPSPPREEPESRLTGLRGLGGFIADGARFVWKNDVVRAALLLDFWATFFSTADALLPAFAGDIFQLGGSGFGVLGSSIAVGALIGAVSMAFHPPRRSQGLWVLYAVAAYGLATILFGLSTNMAIACVLLAATGAADMVSTVLRQTIRQLATPDNMRGRMTSFSMIFQISGPQLGDYEAGLVGRLCGERISVVIGGSVCLLLAAKWRKSSPLVRFDAPELPAG